MSSTLTLSDNIGYWPRQKRSESEKNEKFFKDCADVGMTLADNADLVKLPNGVRSTKHKKQVWYGLYDNRVDKREVEKTLNPLGLFNTDEFPASYRNYPLLNPSINLLCGEERKRIFNPMVTVINADAITEKVENMDKMWRQMYIEEITATSFNEEEVQQRIEKFNTHMKYNYKDVRERMGTQMLRYLYHTQDLKEQFSRGFKDALIVGEEIYIIEIYGGEPILRKANPKNISTIRSGSSWKIEESDIIVEDCYLSIGETIDRYYDYLTDKQVKAIEDGYSTLVSTGGQVKMLRPEINAPKPVEYVDLSTMGVGDINAWTGIVNGAYDAEGNVRVTRIVWAGMRKVGILTFFDENGELQKDTVPEQYKPAIELGENVDWRWIKEWYETTKIGPIYVKMQPCEIQMRHRDNLSMSHPGIVGSVYNTNDDTGKGLIGIGEDWQYLWNTFMYRTELAFIKDRGKVGMFPIHLIPDSWGAEAALFWAENLGWLPIDAFNQGQEGFAKGKLAGAMSGMPTQMDLSNDNQIQNDIQMLKFIKEEVDNLTGITPQRRGTVDNRETVGGVERSVLQSSNITEEWFSVHDNTRVRALRALLEAAKIAYKGKSFVKEFVLDDGTKQMLEFDYNIYREACYGVDVSNASDDAQVLQALKGLSERYLQAGGNFGLVAELMNAKDRVTITRKIQEDEQQKQQQAQEQFKAEQETVQAQIQKEMEIKDAELVLEYDRLDREDMNKQLDREAAIQRETIKALGFAQDTDVNDNNVPDVLEQSKLALQQVKQSQEILLKEKELEVKKRRDEKDIEVKEKELAIKKEELAVKERDSQRKLKIAKTNKNRYDK